MPISYRDLFRVAGVPRLVASMLIARLGGSMNGVVIVLFVLDRYHSPTLAGVVALASQLPGTLLSPVAGALLDRYGRVRLVILDYVVGALTCVAVAVPAAADALPPWLLVLIAALSSLTLPLAISGSRSLMPLTVPRRMWDRGNAVDAATWEVSSIFGPALAGGLVAVFGPVVTLAGLGATWVVAGLILARVPEPPVRGATEHHVLREAWEGVVYVFARNPVMRSLSILVPVANVAGGIAVVAVPVLVLDRLHGGAVEVGALWSASGCGGVLGNLLGGRAGSEGRERRLIALGYGGSAAGLVVLALAPNFGVAAAGLLLTGFLTGFGDISMFGLRQRATDPAWFGRTMSISMSVNGAGRPLGAGLAGPLISLSVTFAFLVAAGFWAASGALAALLLRGLDRVDVGAADRAGQAGDAVPVVDVDLHTLEPGLRE